MQRSQSKPDYGIDAPGVIRSFVLMSVAALLGGGIAWSFRRRARWGWLAWLSPIFWLASAASGALSLAMTAYATHGKFVYRDIVLDQIAWRGDEQVLDVGTGRGLLMIGAAKRLTTGKAIGIDIWNAEDLSGNDPANTLRNVRIEGVADRVEIRDGDARALNFADGSFDVVLSLLCLHNIEDKAERATACREIARVLKPGGTALLSDYMNTGDYAQELKRAGLSVTGPIPYLREANGLMWLVKATKDAV